MHITVLGATGLGGSHVCVELLNRGHNVKGLSRNPEKLGKHERYEPVSCDLSKVTVGELQEVLKNSEIVINGYNPPVTDPATVYKTFIETTRKILLASKAANVPYFIMIGGTGSLFLPDVPILTTACDVPSFWVAFRRSVADSEAGVVMMEERSSTVGQVLRSYRNARIWQRVGKPTEEDQAFIERFESGILKSDNPAGDLPMAARASFMLFEGNQGFKWSFVSPPARYRPGVRTAKYETSVDYVPLTEDEGAGDSGCPYDGRLRGISAADLAVAIADECEKKNMVWKHWSAWAELEDVIRPSMARIES